MDQLTLLILLCFSMLVGSYFSGTIPMAFPLSESRSKLLTITGSGILVGTALAIIIPEGVNSIYSESQCIINKPPAATPHGLGSDGQSVPKRDESNLAIPEDYNNANNDESKSSDFDDDQGGRSKNLSRMTFVIGLALVSGFVLMLLIDQFSHHSSQHSTSGQHSQEYTLAPSKDDNDPVASAPLNHTDRNDQDSLLVTMGNVRSNSLSPAPKVTPTLGLVIHASADGIALGAAATTSHREIEMIIFLAIMLHKAPAAFGLVAFLLHRGLRHSTIRRHLLAFSLSAPLAAFVTYFGLSQSGKEALQRNNATGIAMLFSAGTFLYVATVHVLPELVHNRRLSSKEILCFIAGAFLPCLLAQTV